MNLQHFYIFMHIWWLLKFFFPGGGYGMHTKPWRIARTFHLLTQQSLASINNKNSTILTKRPPLATTGPCGTHHHHWALVYWGIPSDLRSRPDQIQHLSGSLLSRWVAPMGVPTVDSTKKALTFTIYDCIMRIRPKKVCYLTKVRSFTLRLNEFYRNFRDFVVFKAEQLTSIL